MKKDDFESWAHTFCSAVDEAPEDMHAAIGADDGEDALIAAIEPGEDNALIAHADQLFAARRQVAMMATKVNWSPTDDGPSSPAWAIAVVDRGDQAFYGVRRLAEDQQWWGLKPTDCPWFLLSTGASLRKMMAGEPMTLKKIDDKANEQLLRRITDGPPPPVDDKGRI